MVAHPTFQRSDSIDATIVCQPLQQGRKRARVSRTVRARVLADTLRPRSRNASPHSVTTRATLASRKDKSCNGIAPRKVETPTVPLHCLTNVGCPENEELQSHASGTDSNNLQQSRKRPVVSYPEFTSAGAAEGNSSHSPVSKNPPAPPSEESSTVKNLKPQPLTCGRKSQEIGDTQSLSEPWRRLLKSCRPFSDTDGLGRFSRGPPTPSLEAGSSVVPEAEHRALSATCAASDPLKAPYTSKNTARSALDTTFLPPLETMFPSLCQKSDNLPVTNRAGRRVSRAGRHSSVSYRKSITERALDARGWHDIRTFFPHHPTKQANESASQKDVLRPTQSSLKKDPVTSSTSDTMCSQLPEKPITDFIQENPTPVLSNPTSLLQSRSSAQKTLPGKTDVFRGEINKFLRRRRRTEPTKRLSLDAADGIEAAVSQKLPARAQGSEHRAKASLHQSSQRELCSSSYVMAPEAASFNNIVSGQQAAASGERLFLKPGQRDRGLACPAQGSRLSFSKDSRVLRVRLRASAPGVSGAPCGAEASWRRRADSSSFSPVGRACRRSNNKSHLRPSFQLLLHCTDNSCARATHKAADRSQGLPETPPPSEFSFQNFESESSNYLELHLCKNIQDANATTGSADYFKLYAACEHGRRISAASRRAILQYIIDIGRGVTAPISDFTIHMAMNLFDRFLSRLGHSDKIMLKDRASKEVEVIGAACLYICSKMEDAWCLSLGDICKVFDEGSEKRRPEVLFWELEISREFHFMFYSPTVLDFLYKMVDLALPHLEASWASKKRSSDSNVESTRVPLIESSGNCLSSTPQQLHCSKLQRSWSHQALESFAGTGNSMYTKPASFIHSPSPVPFKELLLAEAASIAELSLLHHTVIGTPVHLLAAASLLVAVTLLLGKQRRIDNLPQPVRALLGRDRTRLAQVTCLVASVVDEQHALAAAKLSPSAVQPRPTEKPKLAPPESVQIPLSADRNTAARSGSPLRRMEGSNCCPHLPSSTCASFCREDDEDGETAVVIQTTSPASLPQSPVQSHSVSAVVASPDLSNQPEP